MKVIGVDQASVSGFCLAGDKLHFREWRCGHFRAPKRPEEGERLLVIYDKLIELIDEFEPDLIALETPFDPSFREAQQTNKRRQFSQSTLHFLQRVKAAVLMAASRRSVPTEEYQPRSWRTALRLPNKPPGADSQWIKRETKRVLTQLGVHIETLDEADAAGIAYYALHGKAGVKRATEDLFDRARAAL